MIIFNIKYLNRVLFYHSTAFSDLLNAENYESCNISFIVYDWQIQIKYNII